MRRNVGSVQRLHKIGDGEGEDEDDDNCNAGQPTPPAQPQQDAQSPEPQQDPKLPDPPASPTLPAIPTLGPGVACGSKQLKVADVNATNPERGRASWSLAYPGVPITTWMERLFSQT